VSSLLVELLRPYWIPGIHTITGHQLAGIQSWITSEKFQIYSPVRLESTILNFSPDNSPVAAFAGDASRMASASIESIEGISPSPALPKSIGWLLIRVYYASFFAGHAILRMLGRSCSQLDQAQLESLDTVAELFGQQNEALTRGLYLCTFDASAKAVTLSKMDSTGQGSHGAMWRTLYGALGDISTDLLASGLPARVVQPVSGKLIELREALSQRGTGNGTWLSFVRNRANYQLSFGAWFPYTDRLKYYEKLFESLAMWRRDPLDISIWLQEGRELQRFVDTCVCLVAICRAMSEDMAARCPKGKPFHGFGCLAVINHLSA
jgi:hypothetical protein